MFYNKSNSYQRSSDTKCDVALVFWLFEGLCIDIKFLCTLKTCEELDEIFGLPINFYLSFHTVTHQI